LQRIKALVTGSLSTFVDIGFNFGGASIAEDSIIQQLRQVNKAVRAPRTALPMGSPNLLFRR
jgi:phosphatidylinositol glycan class O